MMVKVTTSLSWMDAASSMSVWVDINFINYLQFIGRVVSHGKKSWMTCFVKRLK